MSKLFITKGLPGSGKTTWSKEYQQKNPNTVRVNKDDLRAMLHNSIHSRGREDFVLRTRNFIVENALRDGHDVIVDDTNFNFIHEQELAKLAFSCGATPIIQDFRDITPEECIERDLKRPNSVGQKVIWDMYNKYIDVKSSFLPKYQDPSLPFCIMCDLDGTLALFGDKNPYDRDFEEDDVNQVVAGLLLNLQDSGECEDIIFVSGRQEKTREQTERWLKKVGVEYAHLYMRPTGDSRRDFIVKEELYRKHIEGKYNVRFVLDDRNQVVKTWRSLGLHCFQVAEGNF